MSVVNRLAAEPDEVFQRSVTSRAYYAAYLESRSLCEDHLGFVRTARGAEHQEIPRLLGAQDIELKTKLVMLRSLRNAADYDIELSAETIARSADNAQSYAAWIITRLDHHRAAFVARQPSSPPDADQDA